jgi:hypothetical protein
MTEEKKSPNPFINMANDAKKKNAPMITGKKSEQKAPKPSKGFGGASVVRRTGRGG